MTMLILANAFTWVLATLFFVVAAFMILVILVQKPKGGGLSGAFGGGGGGGQQAVFGARVGDVLTVVTTVVFVIFLLLAIGLVYSSRSDAPAGGSEAMPAGTTPTPVTGQPAPEPIDANDANEPADDDLMIDVDVPDDEQSAPTPDVMTPIDANAPTE